MCKFFSFISNGRGKYLYMADAERRQIIAGTLKDKRGHKISDTDSHSSIAAYHGVDEDRWNKYEFNPWTQRFKVDQTNAKRDDRESAEKWANALDFALVEPRVVVEPIIHPFRDKRRCKVNATDITNLKARASVRASVGDSVWASVGASVGDSVWDSIWASVRASVRASVGDSVWASVGDSVWDSVGASVWDSVYGYISNFVRCDNWKYVKHEPGQNPFQPCIDLWKSGLVPSFDGKTWRLHGGKDAKVLYEREGRE